MAASNGKTHMLVLHTSCQDLPDSSETAINRNTTTLEDMLESLPIVCDFLLLPEIPTSDASSSVPTPSLWSLLWSWIRSSSKQSSGEFKAVPDFIELIENPLAPCGLSNLLLIENLPWHQVLLSLTSCHMIHETNNTGNAVYNGDGDDGSLSLLPIDAVPSTFHFDFVDGKATADIFVNFDLTQAREYLQEEHMPLEDDTSAESSTEAVSLPMFIGLPSQHETSAKKNDVLEWLDDSDFPMVQAREANPLEYPTLEQEEKHSFPPKHSTAQQEEDYIKHEDYIKRFVFDVCMNPMDRQEQGHIHIEYRDKELETLQSIQATIERDATNLDQLLYLLSLIALGLLLALLWSGIQLYKDKCEVRRLRELKKVLGPPGDHQVTSKAASLRRIKRALDEDFVKQIVSRHGRKNVQRDLAEPIYQNSSLTFTSDMTGHCTPRIDNRSCRKVSATYHASPMNQGSSSAAKLYEPSIPKYHSPAGATASRKKNNDEKLSPLSKFSKEWVEQKQIRRSHRKRGTNMLEPTSISARAVGLHPSTQNPSHPLATSKADDIHIRFRHRERPWDQNAADKFNSRSTPEKEASQSPPPIPELVCATPGSADSAFIEDYW